MLFDEDLPSSLWNYLNNCTRQQLFEGLTGALDHMEHYNGQSKFRAICQGFGFEPGEKDGSFKIPVIKPEPEPKEFPHVPAAYINAIADEGDKKEAITYLQKSWNEVCWLRNKLKSLA